MANLCSPTCLAVVLKLSKNITLRQRNRALESPKSRWKNNIKIDLSGIECDIVDWIEPARDRIHWRTFVNIGINRLIPQNQNIFSTCVTVKLTRNILHYEISQLVSL